MKNFPFKRQFLFIASVLLLILSACVMPFPGGDEDVPDVDPPVDTIIVATALPIVEATAIPEPATDAGATDDTAAEPAATTEETTEAAEPAAEVSDETTPDTEEPGAEPTGDTTHIVKSGETLGHIAQQYDISVEDIAAANNITNFDSLDVGQELIIKAGAAAESGGGETTPEGGELVHIVQSGDNLFRIGLRYGFSAEELAAHNNIPDVTQIDVGQVIKIPPK